MPFPYILQKHDLLLLQPIDGNYVKSIIIDIDETKDNIIESGIELTNQTDPQKRGSEITYYRRYTLQSLLGLQAEDDDANATVKKASQTEDTRPWLDAKGFTYLLEKGSAEEIATAFKTRRMKKDYRTQLESK
jgi:hypothetical protein